LVNRAAVRFVCCKFARMNEPLYAAIWRGKANGSFRTYEVPRHESQTIRDLVSDMREFFDKWSGARGEFVGSRTRRDDFARITPSSPKRVAADAGVECIG